MSKIYPLLAVLSWLLLTGCDRERTSQEAATTAATPPLADTTRAAALPVAAPADSAAAVSHTVDPVSGAKISSANFPRPVAENQPAPRVKRGATVFADVADEPIEDADVVGNKAASAHISNNTAELTRFLQTGLPAPQLFRIRPGRDTLVTGAQGTQVLVPARAWDLPDSTTAVQLTLQEFYKATDMISRSDELVCIMLVICGMSRVNT
ncbi:hypothetical protein, partial [Hymenobacter glaciei]|uniref:hypothetical protein n=1 Tax=Hymenobacter glaciei TaxID=877209 RepID=UPI0031EBB7B5